MIFAMCYVFLGVQCLWLRFCVFTNYTDLREAIVVFQMQLVLYLTGKWHLTKKVITVESCICTCVNNEEFLKNV